MTQAPNVLRTRPAVNLALVMMAISTTSVFATAANAAAPRTPQSIECSKQADAKGLHGKDREKFRATCKRHAMAPQMAPQKMPSTQTAPAKTSY